MKTVFFLLLRLICYAALATVIAAGFALIIVWVNGRCSPLSEIGMTCATKFSQRLADFGFSIAMVTLDTAVGIDRVVLCPNGSASFCGVDASAVPAASIRVRAKSFM